MSQLPRLDRTDKLDLILGMGPSWFQRQWQIVMLAIEGHLQPLRSFTVAGLPVPTADGLWVFVTNEVGGAVPAFSLGGVWRRCTDRAVVS